ncbi:uncharacterized protein LOC120352313 [Nilaparvata lugens]|uniref:uncharacterized protein LOC120352313 n=1 Tax=Nilaparvata lugens TaxID=108931 RepID=UPI00193CBCB0|nr:uncharacterized protein LOC120352313 [Nilaparvata lugens]
MERSYRKNVPPSCATRQEKATSDSVGGQLQDKNVSQHSKSLMSVRTRKEKIKYKQINYIATHKEIEPVTSTIKKKRISFFGHLIRASEDRLSRRIIEKLWKSKTNIKWIDELKEDMRELNITFEDLKNKSDNIRILKDKQTRLQIKVRHRMGRVISDEERKLISERMKKYWAERGRSKGGRY